MFMLLAADITVRREGHSFVISGSVEPSEIAVFVGGESSQPVLGKITRIDDALRFDPRFPIAGTVAVRVKARDRVFEFPAMQSLAAPTTRVERIYPTTDQIPANQLKFYVEFSAAMLPGEAWQNVELLDSNRKPIELAFLELDPELWDREHRRLTILFDPGRIKRGVLPRDEVGAALEAGKTYTLQVKPSWRDANRVRLAAAMSKSFTVVEEDRTAIDPASWKLHIPKAGTREPLVIDFHESLDAALALRLITMPIEGVAELGSAEASWKFTPAQAWQEGQFEIAIDTALEDLAGNKVGRPFDVDTFDPVTVSSGRGVVRLPVEIR